MSNPTVLYVDRERSSRATALERLREHARCGEDVRSEEHARCGENARDVTFVTAESVAAATETLAARDVDCVVTEYDLPDGNGLEVAERVRDEQPDAGCVLYTETDRTEIETEEAGGTVAEFVPKGFPDAAEELWRVVEFTVESAAQTAYPLPQDEAERLDALDAYELDPETLQPDVQRLTDLAARHFDAPQASVNLIEEHSQQFLACHSTDWTPTSREDSICTYTILDEGEVTVIEDVKADPRFADNQSLEELGIRSYAGANLTTEEGLSIGTLCVYDDEPRTFSADDRAFLGTLADVAMSVIDLRHEVSELESESTAPAQGGEES